MTLLVFPHLSTLPQKPDKLHTFIAPFRDITDTEKFKLLMGTIDPEVLEMFVKFVDECFHLRNSSGK